MEELILKIQRLKKYVCSVEPTEINFYSQHKHGCESYNEAINDVIKILNEETLESKK